MTLSEKEITAIVTRRLFQEVLYELQTGGGIDFNHLQPDDGQRHIIALIRKNLTELKALFSMAPQRVAFRLAKPNLRVLDLGSGRAPWSLAIAAAWNDIRVTAIDLPEQIETLEQTVRRYPDLGDRFTVIGIDFFGNDWFETVTNNTYDLILIANVCHLFSSSQNQELLRRALPMLRDDGTLAIIDQVLEEDPDWPRWGALYTIGALNCSPGGYLFSGREYAAWLSKYGSWNIVSHPISPIPPLTLISARRVSKGIAHS